MAINQNHTVEEINGVRCAVVEKNISKERADFLKQLLEINHYQVLVTTAPPPKAAQAKPLAEGETVAPPLPTPELFNIGVTDFTFNSINAVYGRALHTANGHIVTPAYWEQRSSISNDEVPYYQEK